MDGVEAPPPEPGGPATSVVVLWHGRGPNEAHVMATMARALEREGHELVVPDWDAGSPDGGAGALWASLEHAAARASTPPATRLVVVGWSLGGRAAISLALDPLTAPRVTAVVGLAAGLRRPSPLDGTVPLERVLGGLGHVPPPIHLIHGRQDTVVPPEVSEEFARACRSAGIRCSLALVDSDHAGVIGTTYDPERRLCVPADGPAATTGLGAALAAVRKAARS